MKAFDIQSRADRRADQLYGMLDGFKGRKQLPWQMLLGYMTEALYEDHPIAAAPIFAVANNGTQYTGAVDMSLFTRVQFLCHVGTLGGGGICTFTCQQSNNANMVTYVNVLGPAGTQNANVAISTASQIARIEIRADQLTRRYVQCQCVVTVNQSNPGCIPMASEARMHPQGGTSVDVSYPNIVTQ